MATGENRVRWDLLDPGTYEDMVAVLLSRLKPGTARLDGSGGDGGRDCYFDEEDGREAYQLKSFTGRLSGNRRRQVERSLASAGEHSPVRWFLVVPIDPSQAELRWFEKLADSHPFPIRWYGRTWLDDQMARHPDIHRYFVEGAADEVFQRLRELEQEKAALTNGVEDALDRINTIRGRLNEIDPFYEFSVAVTPEGHQIGIRPRYVGADQDRPIRGTIMGTFPDTPEGKRAREEFEEAIAFGLPVDLPGDFVEAVEIDAPAGLGGRLERPSLSIRPTNTDVNVRLIVKVTDLSGSTVGQLPITVRQRTAGHSGMVLTGGDRSGVLVFTMRVRNDGKVDFNYRLDLESGVLPSDLGPALALLSVLQAPNLLTIRMVEPDIELVTDLPINASPIIEAGQRKLVDDLARLQSASAVHFELPEALSTHDVRQIDDGVKLLDGDSVELAAQSGSIKLKPKGDQPRIMRVP